MWRYEVRVWMPSMDGGWMSVRRCGWGWVVCVCCARRCKSRQAGARQTRRKCDGFQLQLHETKAARRTQKLPSLSVFRWLQIVDDDGIVMELREQARLVIPGTNWSWWLIDPALVVLLSVPLSVPLFVALFVLSEPRTPSVSPWLLCTPLPDVIRSLVMQLRRKREQKRERKRGSSLATGNG